MKPLIAAVIVNSFIIVSAIISMVMAILIRSELQNNPYEFILELGQNWRLTPITNLKTENPTGFLNCVVGENVINNDWQGTFSGCRCPSALQMCSSSDKIVKQAQASSTLRSRLSGGLSGFAYGGLNYGYGDSKCTNIASISSQNFTQWDSYFICRETPANNYFDLKISDSNSCDISASKVCGIVDSLGNRLCVPSTSECPINDMKIIDNTSQTPAGYKELTTTYRKIVYTTSSTTSNIPIYFKVAGDTPCLSPAEDNFKPFGLIVENTNSFGCTIQFKNSAYDPYYKKLDSYNYYDFLNQNGILALMKSRGLAEVDNYSDALRAANASLYVKSYIGLKTSCRDYILTMLKSNGQTTASYIQNFVNVSTNMQQVAALTDQTFVVVILSAVIVIIISCSIISCKCTCWGKFYLERCTTLYVAIGICMALVIACIGLVSGLISVCNNLGNGENMLVNCMDDGAEMLLNQFTISKQKILNCAAVELFFFLLCLVLYCFEIYIGRSSMDGNHRIGEDDSFQSPNELKANTNNVDTKNENQPLSQMSYKEYEAYLKKKEEEEKMQEEKVGNNNRGEDVSNPPPAPVEIQVERKVDE